MIKLWRSTCLKYFRDPAALRGAARKAGYLENPPNGDSMLGGQSGIVWDASSSVYSQRTLVSLDNGVCEVTAR